MQFWFIELLASFCHWRAKRAGRLASKSLTRAKRWIDREKFLAGEERLIARQKSFFERFGNEKAD